METFHVSIVAPISTTWLSMETVFDLLPQDPQAEKMMSLFCADDWYRQ